MLEFEFAHSGFDELEEFSKEWVEVRTMLKSILLPDLAISSLNYRNLVFYSPFQGIICRILL